MSAFDWASVWPGCETVTLVLTKAEAAALRSRARAEGRLRAGGKVILSEAMADELAFARMSFDELAGPAYAGDPKIAILPAVRVERHSSAGDLAREPVRSPGAGDLAREQLRSPGSGDLAREPVRSPGAGDGRPAARSARVLFFPGVKKPQPEPLVSGLPVVPVAPRRSILDEKPPRQESPAPEPASGVRFLPGRGKVTCAEPTREEAKARAAEVAAAIAAGTAKVTRCPPRTFALAPELEGAMFDPRHRARAVEATRRRHDELLGRKP